jgi:hypothetical protein
MRQSLTTILALVTALAVVTFLSPVARADTYQLVLSGTPGVSPIGCGSGSGTCGSFTFTTSVTQTGANTYDIVFDVKNTGQGSPLTYDTAYLQGFGLTLFNGSISGTTVTYTPPLVSGITAQLVDNSKTNNGGSNSHCNNSQNNTGSVCLDITSSSGINISGAGAEQQFEFMLTLASGGSLVIAPDTWHIMANGTNGPSGGGNDFALTQDGTPYLVPPPPTPPVPEPASMALFGTGLAAVSGFIRRRRR